MPKVKLTSKFWDGENVHPVGAEIFIENPPDSAIDLDSGKRIGELKRGGAFSAPSTEVEKLQARIRELEEENEKLREPELPTGDEKEEESKEPSTLSELAKKEDASADPTTITKPTPPSALVKKGGDKK